MPQLRPWLFVYMLFPAAMYGAHPSATTVHRPLVFEPNQGQARRDVKFLGRSGRYTLVFRAAEVQFQSFRMRLAGANPQARMEGLDRLPGRSFYYLGNDPSRWQTGLPQFARLRYRDIYPGIDVVFYGKTAEVEYDLLVAPHADLDRVCLSFDGARGLSVDANGDLRIEFRDGVLWQKKPVIYQESRGVRRQIRGNYVVEDRQVRIAVEGRDPERLLVIDPVIVYATYFGGSGDEQPCRVAVDTAGNAYVTGTTTSLDFPAVPKTSSSATRGGRDVFVTKLDPAGKNVLYSVILGGSNNDGSFGIAVDPAGNAYLTGDTLSINFPTKNAYQSSNKGAWDAFVTKLDPSGNLVYSTYLGGGQREPYQFDPNDDGFAIVADAAGNAYVTGMSASTDFPVTRPIPGPALDQGEAFIAEFGPAGNLVYSTLLGGSGWDAGFGIALGGSGTVWVAGASTSPDLPVTPGVLQTRFAGGDAWGDAWVAKINLLGSAQNTVLALTYLGGSGDDDLYSLQVDSSGNVYVAGLTMSPDFPVTTGALQTKFGGGIDSADAWVAKLNPTLTSRLFVTYFGGAGDDGAESLALDASGNVYVLGYASSPGLTPLSLGNNPGALQAGYGGNKDAFLLELNPAGTAASYFTYIGGSGTDEGRGLALDGSGNLYLVLITGSANMPVVRPALQPTIAGGDEAFLMRVNLSASPVKITSVEVAYGGTDIAQNTWIAIKGTGLAPSDLPNGWLDWSNAPEIPQGKLPAQLSNVSVKVNNKAGYINYISPTQVNVLTPLDSTTGSVQVQLTQGANTSDPFMVNMKALAPAFFLLGATKYIAAQHLDYSLVGPASMSAPGYPFTPARPGETIVLYANGFGLPVTTLADGSAAQSGLLPNPPLITIGGAPATVGFAGVVAPGLYQFNVTVPATATDGDNVVSAMYNGFTTPAGALITVQR